MILAIDMGGTFIKYGWVTNKGEIVYKDKVEAIRDKETFYAFVKEKCLEHPTEGIALSVPGVADAEKGTVLVCGAYKFLNGLDICEELKELTNRPVSVENDGRCAALCEAFYGAAKDVNSCSIIVLGTGIGSASIINRKLLRGSHMIAGEICRLGLPTDMHTIKPDMVYGMKYGTVDVANAVSEKLGYTVNGYEMMELYEQGNETVKPFVDEWAYYIACLCYQFCLFIDPDMICIGGGISASDTFMDLVRKYVHLIYENSPQFYEPTVVSCQSNNDANLLGAVCHFVQLNETSVLQFN